MATTKITNPELFDLGSLNTALQLPSGTTAERPTSPSTGEWRYNTTTYLIEFWDGGAWRDLQSEDIPPIPSEHFNTVTYTGTGGTQAITGVGFQPDWVWIKNTNDTNSHILQDTTRGAGLTVFSNLTSAQDGTSGDLIASFDSDGFTVNENFNGSTTNESTNKSGNTYVAWCWKANGGTTSSNTDGTITSTVQVNTKAGFSVMRYTGNGSFGATIGHGLGAAPDLIISRNLTSVTAWGVYHKYNTASPAGQRLKLDLPDLTLTTNDYWAGVEPTSTVLSVGTEAAVNDNTKDYIMYAFKAVAGYSAFGSYAGNGSDNGPIINTGFEPAWLMIKVTTGSADGWFMVDNKRDTSNPRGERVFANSNVAEASEPGAQVDFLTNGFQLRGSGGGQGQTNGSGNTYVYIAFASDPSAAPVLANSFTTNLYTGNGGTKILGTGFNPSLAWLKRRSSTASHSLTDLVRGNNLVLQANEISTEASGTISLTSTGIDIGSSNALRNSLNSTYVAWSWQGNSLPSINTDGSTQSFVSANQAAGFSVVKWPQTAATSTNVGHGLNSAPDLIITKAINDTDNWYVYNSASGVGKFLYLNLSNAEVTSATAYSAVDATTFTANLSNNSGINMISYCFASISGFSKISTYTGTGTGVSQGVTGLGFSPNWVMIKEVDGADSWQVYDTSRGAGQVLYPNGNNAEVTDTSLTSFDSDGFTVTGNPNESGKTYLYVAFKNNREFAAAGTMAFTVVAGGGGGGASQGLSTSFAATGCGGGAGGFRGSGDVTGGQCTPQDNITLASGTYTVTVGAGGSPRVNGSASSIAGPSMTTISTVGGGRGADDFQQSENGGSGGGRSFFSSNNGYSTACEGFGRTLEGLTSWQAGGGGADGIQASLGVSNASGKGVSSIMSGTYEFYAGGGAPGSGNTTRPQAAPGGGGNGQISGETAANTPAEITGAANTGGGGGGGSQNTSTAAKGDGGSGGSGIVILRLKTSEYSGTVTGSPTVTTDGDETIIKFTASGTYVH